MHISSRTNTILLVMILAVGVAITAMLATGARGGPLDPPLAPASTDGVREPGTPISSLPFGIGTPGRYYVTRNLSYSGANGITIGANDVVLDLGGFTIDGLGAGTFGIYDLGQAHQNVNVRHGTVRGFSNGIWLPEISSGNISDVRVIGRGTTIGYGIRSQQKGTIEDCDVMSANTGVDLLDQTVMRRCHIHEIGGAGVQTPGYAVVEDSVIELATTAGIYSSGQYVTIRNNRFAKNAGGTADVIVGSGTAAVLDNVLSCEGSAYASGGLIVTSGPGGQHANVPLFAAGFCTGH